MMLSFKRNLVIVVFKEYHKHAISLQFRKVKQTYDDCFFFLHLSGKIIMSLNHEIMVTCHVGMYFCFIRPYVQGGDVLYILYDLNTKQMKFNNCTQNMIFCFCLSIYFKKCHNLQNRYTRRRPKVFCFVF